MRTGPIRTRTSRSIGASTAPNIRRSWRFQPCRSTARYQVSPAGAGGSSSLPHAPDLDLRHHPQVVDRCDALLELDALAASAVAGRR